MRLLLLSSLFVSFLIVAEASPPLQSVGERYVAAKPVKSPTKFRARPKVSRPKAKHSVSELDKKPRLVSKPVVKFPSSIKNASKGSVVVKVKILPSGKSQFVSVLSSTHPDLIPVAKVLANDSYFTAPTRQGKPVETVMTWPITIKKSSKASKPKFRYSVGELDRTPRLVSIPKVKFPKSIRDTNSGRVVINVLISDSGKSQFLSVLSSTHSALIPVAKHIANGSHFTPPTRQGKPVKAVMTWPITIKK